MIAMGNVSSRFPVRVIPLVLAVALAPVPVRADGVFFRPGGASLALGQVWLLLVAGILALRAAALAIDRMFGRYPSPTEPTFPDRERLAVVLGIAWVIASGFLFIVPRPREVDPALFGLLLCPVVVVAVAGLWSWVASAARVVLGRPLAGPNLPAAAAVSFACCLGCSIVLMYDARASLEARGAHLHANGEINTLVAAQARYSTVANQGYFDGNLRCLAEPSSCIPDYPAGTGPFIQPAIAADQVDERWGYRRVLHPGPPPASLPAGASPSSVQHYAYTIVRASEKGWAICVQDTGLICYFRDGRAPTVTDGQCSRDGDCPAN